MEARFIVGPPGTGKTHTWLVKKYEECFSKYTPEKIILSEKACSFLIY